MLTLTAAAFFALCIGPFEALSHPYLNPIQRREFPSNLKGIGNDTILGNMISQLTSPYGDCTFPPRDVLINPNLDAFKFLEQCNVKLEMNSKDPPDRISLLCMSLFDIGLRLCHLNSREAFASALLKVPHNAEDFHALIDSFNYVEKKDSKLCMELLSVLPSQPLDAAVWNLKKANDLGYKCQDLCFEYYHTENIFCHLILWGSNVLHGSELKYADVHSVVTNLPKMKPRIELNTLLNRTSTGFEQPNSDPIAQPIGHDSSVTMAANPSESREPFTQPKLNEEILVAKPKVKAHTDNHNSGSQGQGLTQTAVHEDGKDHGESQDPSQTEVHSDASPNSPKLQGSSQTDENNKKYQQYTEPQDPMTEKVKDDVFKSSNRSQPLLSTAGKQKAEIDPTIKSNEIYNELATDLPSAIVQGTSVDQSNPVGAIDPVEDAQEEELEHPSQEVDIDENDNIVGEDDQTVQGENPIKPDNYESNSVNSGKSSNEINSYMPDEGFEGSEDSHFFVYFMSMILFCIFGYLIFHNKQKIMALALEGRSRRNGSRRRPNSANYHKLDCNLEEAVSSPCSTSTTHVIY